MKVQETFSCIRLSDKEECQAIITTNNIVYVGIDVWRLLNRSDTCSYPVQKYYDKDEALKNVIRIPTRKAYYMPERKTYGNIS